jgi:hypothetical protein
MVKEMLTMIMVIALVSAAQFAQATANEAAQTDWSGGPGVLGPVTDWGDKFDSEDYVSWSGWPGELILEGTPLTTPIKHVVTNEFVWVYVAYAEDVDGDEDVDIVGSATNPAYINWWENEDCSGTLWIEHTIETDSGQVVSVYATDLDGDDDTDVLGAAYYSDDVIWWENDDGLGGSWTKHIIDGNFDYAIKVYSEDIDDDGDLDVLGAAYNADEVTWWENDDGSGISWTEHNIDGEFDGAYAVYAADIDGDDDIDVVGGALEGHIVVWWENDDGSGTSWTEHTIDGLVNRPRDVFAEDVDGDGDMDVLCAVELPDEEMTWWENLDGSGTSWEQHTIDNDFENAYDVYAEDMDGDGDIDVLGAAVTGDEVKWWENDDGSGTSWTGHTVETDFMGALSVHAADVDGNGGMDVIGAAWEDNEISWWEVVEFKPSGELISSIYDTAGSPVWGQIDWTSDMPADTTLKFQVRSSDDYAQMGNWSADVTSPGSLEPYLEDGDQYMQYKVILGTDDTKVTPTLYDVTMDWVCTDITLMSFSAESVPEGIRVRWECGSAVAGFNLYRSTHPDSERAITSRDKLNTELITGESPHRYLDTGVEEQITYDYWLEAVDVSGTSETFGPVECTWRGALPTAYALYQSRPNPAMRTATIAFDLPEDAGVTLTIYDINGRKVKSVVNRAFPAGEYEAEVSGLAPGVYVYRLEAGEFNAARKMVIVGSGF